MKKLVTTTLVLSSLLMSALAFAASSKDRGNDFDYDAGPSDTSSEKSWADLIAETPNYRAFGKAVLSGGGEKFRWKMGPMHYRGRLGQKDQVKVFIIGQEGAQDENVSNRSFTGSTGTRMQKFLNYLGVNRSYLFMNTFVYTITGQYTGPNGASDEMLQLSQSEDSIIVQHRHEMFEKVLAENRDSLAVVIGVGTAGKDSTATWANKLNGNNKCANRKLSKGCKVVIKDREGNNRELLFVGVMHPGAASARNGGSAAGSRLIVNFRNVAKVVSKKIEEKGSRWFPKDNSADRDFSKDFKYGYHSVPHIDFAYGTNWRMGAWATTSNRRRSHAIQVFSADGCYNNAKREAGANGRRGRCSQTAVERLKYNDPKDLLGKKPAEMEENDLGFEMPKGKKRNEYDKGPGKKYAQLMMDVWNVHSDWQEVGAISHKSFGPQSMFRGRLDNAKVLVIADQFSHDDMFSGRALTGTQGQLLQEFLSSMGVTKSYAVIRTLPVDTLDAKNRNAIIMDPKATKARAKLIQAVLDENKTWLILTLGEGAKKVVSESDLNIHEQTKIVDVSPLTLGNEDELKKRNKALKQIKGMESVVAAIQDSSNADWKDSGKIKIIPRIDLPFNTRWWMGTSGDRAARAQIKTTLGYKPSGDYYKFYAPNWSNKTRVYANSMNSKECRSAKKLKPSISCR